MLIKVDTFLNKVKYEFLLFALIQHTFSSIFLDHVSEYTKIWPFNMAILIFGCFNAAWNENFVNRVALSILALGVVILPFISLIEGLQRSL